MYDRTQLREIISGSRTGPGAMLVRILAAGGEPFYYAGSAWRNRKFDRNPARCRAVGVPVISVGNITVGGTGKTPMVQWIACHMQQHGLRVALVSRGYGAKQGTANDEALELAQKLPGVPHIQNPDRVAAAELAIKLHDCQCIVLDDAFQHRRIARDLDLVLIDATEPFGYDHLLPRGLLRESLTGLRRAHAVVLSRADRVSAAERDRIWQTVARYTTNLPRIEAAHAPTRLLASSGTTRPLADLQGASVAAFCGIGNPAAFRGTLEAGGGQVTAFRAFPDHHQYNTADLHDLAAWVGTLSGVDFLVCTQKDLVKLGVEQIAGVPLFALEIGMAFLAGQSELESLLDGVL